MGGQKSFTLLLLPQFAADFCLKIMDLLPRLVLTNAGNGSALGSNHAPMHNFTLLHVFVDLCQHCNCISH